MVACIAAALSLACIPARALTVDNGIVLITQADALAGNVTPGDTPGFPITISAPGSYRLASNLSVSADSEGFMVSAPEVTIDFAGFRMIGSGVADWGVTSYSNHRALTVKNGTIRAFSIGCIRLRGSSAVVERMRLVDCGSEGVSVSALAGSARINRSTMMGGQFGIRCYANCAVRDSHLSNSLYLGIDLQHDGATAIGNLAAFNGSGGISTWNDTVTAGRNAALSNGTRSIGTASVGVVIPIHPNACAPEAC